MDRNKTSYRIQGSKSTTTILFTLLKQSCRLPDLLLLLLLLCIQRQWTADNIVELVAIFDSVHTDQMLVIEDYRAVRRSQLFALARSPVAEFTQHNAGWQQQQQKQQRFINCAHFWLVRETNRCALSGFKCVLLALDWYQELRPEKIPLQAGLSPVLSYLQAPDNFFWNRFIAVHVAWIWTQQPPKMCLSRFYLSSTK